MNYKKAPFVLLLTLILSSCGPTSTPTTIPTIDPTTEPTIEPTIEPTVEPTVDPTINPTIEPTIDPTVEPTTENPTSTTTNNDKEYKIEECYSIMETNCYSDISEEADPYTNVNKTQFYENYTISNSYIDSYFRSMHGLLCGELIDEDGSVKQHEDAPMHDENTYYKNSLARFGINSDGERISYTINTLDGTDYTIYKGGIYVSMNDVAAYLFAFNELPKNYLAGASLKDDAEFYYGELGRVNFNRYSGPSSSKYQYEPYLKGQDDKTLYYREADFGANIGGDHYFTYQDKYNSRNGRGPFRFLVANSYDSSYTYNKSSTEYSTPNPTLIDDRYVYYTWNHYNDFVEYLNYYDGFANPFGNVTAGNPEDQYVPSNPPTQRVDAILAKF